MSKKISKSKVIDVFADVHSHRQMMNLIKRHSTNRHDVREIAIRGLNLRHAGNILDLGCGFGFFTAALKDKIHPRAVVTGVDLIQGYERMFLETCMNAGLEGRFLSGNAPLIKKFQDKTFDLILCSYSLYFFPDLIPVISRILKGHGFFIVITHGRDNMSELVSVTKDVLAGNSAHRDQKLPLESIISQFSSENGFSLLSPWFSRVETVDYSNSLVFRPEDSKELVEYFLFKSPFLLSGTDTEMEWFIHLLSGKLQQPSFIEEGFTISKNDRIYICSLPCGHSKAS